ncbi:uncharacterized protein LOC129923803 isoform X2 [Biomphalaria glabrata]|uniref:Uncharacterized protein LOC129923803 isoform X2 n=1 Tax=Biomphalaria glabrata TaxID=6526 RepID=A0A9W2ZC25_BIOGL|nr:uncharacterized protein LOC129923803 isoform X2 [Biomphalaria glabrata]
MYKRKTITLLLIFMKFSIMFKNVDSSNNHPCPAAYVGESYQLHCPAVSNQEKSLIVWNRDDSQNRSYGEVSRCYFNSTCFTKNTSRIYVNATSSWKSPYSYTIRSPTSLRMIETQSSPVLPSTIHRHHLNQRP